MIRKIHPLSWWLTLFLSSILVIIGSNTIFTLYEIHQSDVRAAQAIASNDRKWCHTLGYLNHTLTRDTVLRRDTLELAGQYGCTK